MTGEIPKGPSDFFPQFSIPQGAYVPGGGGGGGTGAAGMGFDLITDMSIEEVHQYYEDQLLEIGWVELNRNNAEGTIRTYWELYKDGQTWAAYLQVVTKQIDNEDGYGVELRAVLPP